MPTDLKISQLTNGNPALTGDLLPVDRSGSNFAVTAASIAALASSPAITGPGGGFFGPGLTDINSLFGATSLNSVGSGQSGGVIAANVVTVYKFVLTVPFTISKVTAINLSSNGGVTSTFGIYDDNGNLVLDGGQFNCFPATTIQVHSVGPITLPAGVYWHAQGTTSASSPAFLGMGFNTGGNATNAISVWTHNSAKAANAANALSAGALPATLGALTPFVPSGGSGDGICCPFYEV